MRPVWLSIILFSLTNCDSPDSDFREGSPCKDQKAEAELLGLTIEQQLDVVECCNAIGGQCNCVSEHIASCDTDSDCAGGSQCITGWCVEPAECPATSGDGDGSSCPRSCVRGDQTVACASHLTCWDPVSDLCLSCQMCEECGPGCDVSAKGLACDGGRVAPMHSCAQIIALRYHDDKPGQWIQVRNMCDYSLTIKSGLKIGTWLGWTVPITDSIPQLKPGQCHVTWAPMPSLPDADLTGMAEGVGLFSQIAMQTGTVPRDYVLYSTNKNLMGLIGGFGLADAFGFGGEHSFDSHAYRDSFKVWGTATSNQPQSCQ